MAITLLSVLCTLVNHELDILRRVLHDSWQTLIINQDQDQDPDVSGASRNTIVWILLP